MPTILIVDDSAVLRRLYHDLLTRSGYHVLEAEDGVEAWEAIQRCRPALVLLDRMLPGLSGLEVLRRLRADAGTRHIAVIVFSVTAEPEEVEEVLALGANDVAVKGAVPIVELMEKIQALAGLPTQQPAGFGRSAPRGD